MKLIKVSLALLSLTLVLSCGKTVNIDAKSLNSEIDSVSYAVGVSISKQVEFNFKDVNQNLFVQGFINHRDSSGMLIPEKEMQVILSKYFKKQQEKALKKLREEEKEKAKKTEENKKAGKKFLEENKSKDGVKTTASGLQYKVLKEGKGKKIKATDKIRINYHGTLIDGTVFDSTIERKTPYESIANEFVPGFKEGLQLMNKGAKYKFFIPNELAYSSNSIPNKVLPYSALIFEVEILDILNK